MAFFPWGLEMLPAGGFDSGRIFVYFRFGRASCARCIYNVLMRETTTGEDEEGNKKKLCPAGNENATPGLAERFEYCSGHQRHGLFWRSRSARKRKDGDVNDRKRRWKMQDKKGIRIPEVKEAERRTATCHQDRRFTRLVRETWQLASGHTTTVPAVHCTADSQAVCKRFLQQIGLVRLGTQD